MSVWKHRSQKQLRLKPNNIGLPLIITDILRNEELIVNDVENAMSESNKQIQETKYENTVQSVMVTPENEEDTERL